MSTTSATRVALVEHHLKWLDAVLRSFAADGFYEALDRSAQLGLEIQNHAAFVKIQAERKAGDLLAKMPRADTSQNAAKTKTEDQPGPPFSDVLRTAGIAPTRAKRWRPSHVERTARRFASSAWCATTSSTPRTPAR